MHRHLAIIVATFAAPIAALWVRFHEERILVEGHPLTDDELKIAEALGISEPRRIRTLTLPRVPSPVPKFLNRIFHRLGYPVNRVAAISLNLAICLDVDASASPRILAHELTHCLQYQRLGGILPFLRLYIAECLIYGYRDAPLEHEARQGEQMANNSTDPSISD